jgi:hypothetical protein
VLELVFILFLYQSGGQIKSHIDKTCNAFDYRLVTLLTFFASIQKNLNIFAHFVQSLPKQKPFLSAEKETASRAPDYYQLKGMLYNLLI